MDLVARKDHANEGMTMAEGVDFILSVTQPERPLAK
jgi:hypothetical protein